MKEEIKQKLEKAVKVPDEVFREHQDFWKMRMRDPMLYLYAKQALELDIDHIAAQLSRSDLLEP